MFVIIYQFRNVLISNALQKTVFYIVKGGLLEGERRPFARRKTVFYVHVILP